MSEYDVDIELKSGETTAFMLGPCPSADDMDRWRRARVSRVDYSWWYRLRRWPRWVNRAWAFMDAYFWIPCPLCGRSFGGHEWAKRDGHPVCVRAAEGNGKGVCWRCVNKAGVS